MLDSQPGLPAGQVWALSAAAADGSKLLTASWDNSLRLWKRSGSTGNWETAVALVGHTDQVRRPPLLVSHSAAPPRLAVS